MWMMSSSLALEHHPQLSSSSQNMVALAPSESASHRPCNVCPPNQSLIPNWLGLCTAPEHFVSAFLLQSAGGLST